MLVDPSQSGQVTTLASTQAARRPAAANASLFSTALAQASTKATSSSDTSSPQNVSTSTKVPKGEKSEPVKGHAYSEVTAGPRNGMFVNTSGNKRDGQAFALVKRDGREFHVYGTGKNRVIVEVKHKKADDTQGTTNTPTTTDDQSNSSSGGSETTTPSPATDTTGAPAA
jgi:hypothetical protein